MSHTPLAAPPPPGAPPPAAPSSPPAPPSLKVTLLGDSSTGKTSLRQRFVDGGFSGSYRATVGADFLSRELRVREGGEGEGQGEESEVVLQVWDTAGQERFRSLAPAFYRQSHACILFYSLSSRVPSSTIIAPLRSWFDEFVDKCPVDDPASFAWACVGTKADEVEAMDEEGQRRVERLGEEVEEALEKLLPRRRSGGARKERQGESDPPPRIKVDVLPPPTRHAHAKRRPSLQAAIAAAPDPTASAGEPAPPSSSDTPAPQPSTSSSEPSATSSASEYASTSTDSLPFASEPALDLLTSTSPPAPPPHFGSSGAPPAIYVGGPFDLRSTDDPVTAETLDEADLAPDHRGDHPPKQNYGAEEAVGPAAAEREMEAAHAGGAGPGVESFLPGEAGGEVQEQGSGGGYDYTRDGIKHFRRTSAKTGEGVREVFEYLSLRVLASRRLASSTSASTPSSAPPGFPGADSPQKGVIKVGEHEKQSLGRKWRVACCS
ncbi:hypothetical protein JCM10213_001674 [Rhodosporidiobolus nylandii]